MPLNALGQYESGLNHPNVVQGSNGGAVLWVNPITGLTEWVLPPMMDEMFGAGPFSWTTSTLNSGVAAPSGNATEANHFGCGLVSTGTVNNGVATVRTVGNLGVIGSKKLRIMMCIKTPSALSSAVDIYEFFAGFGDATTAANTDAVGFNYSHTINSGKWNAKTMSGGVTTNASNGAGSVTVAANTWYWLLIEADSTSCKFYVSLDLNGSPTTWTHIGTCTANIPTSGNTGFCFQIVKQGGSTGTTALFSWIDKAILIS